MAVGVPAARCLRPLSTTFRPDTGSGLLLVCYCHGEQFLQQQFSASFQTRDGNGDGFTGDGGDGDFTGDEIFTVDITGDKIITGEAFSPMKLT